MTDLFPPEAIASKPPTIPEYRLTVVREAAVPSTDCHQPAHCAAYWRTAIAPHIDGEKEHLIVLLLNAKSRLKGHALVSMGSLNETTAHPREIFRPVIAAAAYAFILMHNHPSGDPAPSDADRRFTSRLGEGARILSINLLDHVIVGTPSPGTVGHFSFRESGLL